MNLLSFSTWAPGWHLKLNWYLKEKKKKLQNYWLQKIVCEYRSRTHLVRTLNSDNLRYESSDVNKNTTTLYVLIWRKVYRQINWFVLLSVVPNPWNAWTIAITGQEFIMFSTLCGVQKAGKPHFTSTQKLCASLEPVDGAKVDWQQLGASYSF